MAQLRRSPSRPSPETGTFLLVIQVGDATRRRRLLGIARPWGESVGMGVIQIETLPSTLDRLCRMLEAEATAEDDIRVYPVCRRCRRGVRATKNVRALPAAWVF